MNQMIVSLLNTLGLKSDPQTVVAFSNTVEEIAQPPVPFSVSVSLEQDFSGSISGLITILPDTVEVPLATIGTGEGQISGFNFYVDTQRGSYWGDLTVTINQSSIFTSEAVLPVMDTSQCNSIVQTDISGEPEAGESYFVSITVSGGGHSITRTFTLNIESE